MKRFVLPASGVAALFLLILSLAQAQSGVSAEAIKFANLRNQPDIQSVKTGEIRHGAAYPVFARDTSGQWLLLYDATGLYPMGWVFVELVTVSGNLEAIPVSTTSAGTIREAMTGTPGPLSGISGVVNGEINVRYGPGADYPRVGVAKSGDSFEIVAYHTLYPWVQVRYDSAPGHTAWIARDLLDITGDVNNLPAVSATDLHLPTLTPTPPAISASTRPEAAPVPLSPEFAALGNQLWQIMLNAGFDLETGRFGALFVLDLQTGEAFSFGSDINFSGTSIAKIAVLARLYQTLSGAPTTQTATDIANTMICSNNASTTELLKVIGNGDEFEGAAEVTRLWNQLGFRHSFLTAPIIDDPAKLPTPATPPVIPVTGIDQTKAHPDATNQLTVEDMGWLLDDIYECAYANSGPLLSEFNGEFEPRECRQMLHVMSSNDVDSLLKSGVPAETRVAHKHGWIGDTHSDAAIFFTPGGNYVVVSAMHQPTWIGLDESQPVMAEISRAIYNYYNPTTPMNTIRDSYIPDAPTCNFAGTPLIDDLRQSVWDK